MKSRRHVSANIEGLLSLYEGKIIDCIEIDGVTLSDKEAREHLADLQTQGHKKIGFGECEGFDPFGRGCPGHPVEDIS